MQMANPMLLWALAGLLVPVVIHLLSRKEGRMIEIGSIRFLRETPTARFRHLKLNEIALFLLRCLLIIIIVHLLTGLEVRWFDGREKWVVLEEGVGESQRMASTLERLRQQGYETRVLSKDFPLLSHARDATPFYNYRIALEELSALPVDSIIVISYNHQHKASGPRLALPPHIRWISADVNRKEFTADKIRISDDSVWIRRGYTSSSITHFQTEKIREPDAGSAAAQPREILVAVVKGEGFDTDYKIVLASLGAIRTATPHKINVVSMNADEGNNSSADFTFWLSNDIPQKDIQNTSIVYFDCAGNNLPWLVPSDEAMPYCSSTGNETWVITKRLNADVALKEDLTLDLARLILPPSPSEDDLRAIPDQMMWSAADSDRKPGRTIHYMKHAEQMLVILLLLTLGVERFLAFKRKQ